MESGKINIFIIILLVAALSGWGMVIYQKELQKQAEERIADVVWEQMEYRRQAEDNIKQDIEAKKKDQEFINQLDYEKELDESINQKIADSENRQTQYYKGLEDSFIKETENRKQFEDFVAMEIENRKQFEDSFTSKIENYQQKQQEYEQELADYKGQVEKYKQHLVDYKGQLEEYKNDAGAGFLSVRNDIARLEEKIDLQDSLISDYHSQLKEIRGRLWELENKQKGFDENNNTASQ